MTAFFGSVAIHSSQVPSQQFAYRESCETPNGGYPNVRRTAKAKAVCDCLVRRITSASRGSGLKPLSVPAEARLCICPLERSAGIEPADHRFVVDSSSIELKRRSHCDVRASVASLPFGRQNTTRRVSFTCRLLDRPPGRWLHARSPAVCAVALACKARTDLHYSLPLTIHDVGVAGCTTTCSFAYPHSRPKPVR